MTSVPPVPATQDRAPAGRSGWARAHHDPRVLLAAVGLLTLGMPAVAGRGWGPFGVLAVVVGLGALARAVADPGSAAPLGVLAVAVLLWLDVSDPGLSSVVLFGAGCYAVHSAAAMAAGVPRGATVPRAVGLRWLVRALPAYGVGTVLAALTAVTGGADGSTGATVLALLAAAALLAVPAIAARAGRG